MRLQKSLMSISTWRSKARLHVSRVVLLHLRAVVADKQRERVAIDDKPLLLLLPDEPRLLCHQVHHLVVSVELSDRVMTLLLLTEVGFPVERVLYSGLGQPALEE